MGSSADPAVDRWLERIASAGGVVGLDARDLSRVVEASEFVANAFVVDAALRNSPLTDEAAPFVTWTEPLDEVTVMRDLRRARRRRLARIAIRDILGVCGTLETLKVLSAVADDAIRAALDAAMRLLAPRFGHIRDDKGAIVPLVVVGMGKLGGQELNFSSDIDLIFLYRPADETDGPRRVDCFEYYTRLGQKLIALLDSITEDGFVFRVDMRLRPFGDSGPLVASFTALEDYLQQHGRDWERYAWIKARAITGTDLYADIFDDVVRPFVFRRYLDFGVFESLREMKGLIAREVERRELKDDVKLGRGGIREVEFIVQALQLVRGGSDIRLRPQSLLVVLPHLSSHKLLSEESVRSLAESYEFLRRLENRLQMYADEQTHRLPADPSRSERIAAGLGFTDYAALLEEFARHRAVVAEAFDTLVLAGGAALPEAADFEATFANPSDSTSVIASLAPFGHAATIEIASELAALRSGGYYRRLGDTGRRRLHAFLPRMLASAGSRPEADAIVRRVLSVVEAIGSRTAYLALLNENPLALRRLIEICALGNYLASQVAAHPLLLDELVDPRLFDTTPSRAQFAEEMALRLEACVGDTEASIAALRDVQRAAIFRVALFDLTDRLPLMRVSDRLTDVAELILQHAMEHAWWDMVAVHGEPRCGTAGQLRTCRIATIGYGKLGGHELGYGSDLDLVFLHDSAGEIQETAGPKVIDNGVFFLRLGQKIVHFLTVHSAAGRLYEVDMRLRPSGKGGLLMTQIDAFATYQRRDAWTWEHQALLHSRAVAGDPDLRARFETIRTDILCREVRRDRLRDDVRQMRERMRRELSEARAGEFDVKQDPGGIADIEFLAQYWVLRHAGDYAPLVQYADTIRQLESIGSAALVDHAVIDRLVAIYRRYRSLVHHGTLEGRSRALPAAEHAVDRAYVTEVWEFVMGGEGDSPPV